MSRWLWLFIEHNFGKDHFLFHLSGQAWSWLGTSGDHSVILSALLHDYIESWRLDIISLNRISIASGIYLALCFEIIKCQVVRRRHIISRLALVINRFNGWSLIISLCLLPWFCPAFILWRRVFLLRILLRYYCIFTSKLIWDQLISRALKVLLVYLNDLIVLDDWKSSHRSVFLSRISDFLYPMRSYTLYLVVIVVIV